MTSRGRGVGRGRGRASASVGGARGGRGLPGPPGSPDANRGRGGTLPSFRGGDRGSGRGLATRGGLLRGRGRAGIFMHGQPADIDPRIANNSDKALVAAFNPAGLASDPDSHLRPDFGTEGREIKLRTNFFPVQLAPDPQGQNLKLYAYHVHITPAIGTLRRVKRRIYDLAERTITWAQAGMTGRVVHDNDARLFSSFLLPQPLTIRIPYYDEGERGPARQGDRVYTLMIVFVQEIDTGQLASYLAGKMQYHNYNASPVIAALTLILTHLPTKTGLAVASKRGKAFMPPFYTAGNMAFEMMAFQNVSLITMGRFFQGVRAETTYLGYRKIVTCRGFTSHTAKNSFDAPEYGPITVEEYFRRSELVCRSVHLYSPIQLFLLEYNIQLQHPDLQLINVGGQTGNYQPAELFDIVSGQPSRKRLADQQVVVMTSVGCQPPNVQGETTVTQLRHQFGLDVIWPELESFGITISPDMAVIPGRILSKPGITYASSVAPSVNDQAAWNLVGAKFAVGAQLDNWAVLVIKDNVKVEFAGASDRDLQEVVSAFRHMCNASGMHVTADPTYATAQLPRRDSEAFDPIRQEAIKTIKETLLSIKPKPTLILVMLANEDKAIYEGVKHLCDVRLDVATVCVQSGKIRRRNPHYLANVALKVNTKLGGINHRLDADDGKWLYGELTMVVGIDTSHPSPGSALGCPSIAAVVASVDNDFTQYPAILEIQNSRMEMITNLRGMMVDRLKLFQKKNNGKLPERILIYRSGISQSHFNHLREIERPLIIEAFKAVSSGAPYRPRFTIVVCSKSRHVRFYPTEQDNATRNGNPLPGTVVDRGITAIYDFDFFLQSHGSGTQGIPRPTHYYVIHDEIRYSADEIQGITNALSYMYAGATQAISMASPVYYANAACQRGRCYLRKLFYGYVGEGGTTTSGTQTGSENGTEMDVMQEARRLWGWGVAGAGLKETMFYL
ncbi:ribonuclease H-like domain-containing protein [Boletus reticuloceps]|uniref:Ribonuclease H-like domain-containing protein n=1 Tax=Boletus reticuloceps TaxID=495285 RepID=A0A8I3ABN5_9AGAM|nr:ribonuclease H-like domain-containing protein [Boletus reticuloceps]